jgi:hypothetical protein
MRQHPVLALCDEVILETFFSLAFLVSPSVPERRGFLPRSHLTRSQAMWPSAPDMPIRSPGE